MGRDDLPEWARRRQAELARTGETPAVTQFLGRAGRWGAGVAILAGLVYFGVVPATALPGVLLGGGQMEGLTLQAILAAVIPIAIMVLRQLLKVIPDGPAPLWINLGLQVLLAVAAALGLDVPPEQAALVASLGAVGAPGLREVQKKSASALKRAA